MTNLVTLDVKLLGKRLYFSIGDSEKTDTSTDKIRPAIGTFHSPAWVSPYMDAVNSILRRTSGYLQGVRESGEGDDSTFERDLQRELSKDLGRQANDGSDSEPKTASVGFKVTSPSEKN